MAATTPPTITPAPATPQRNVKATFSTLLDAFVTWLAASVAQFAALGTNVYNNALDAYNSASAAATAAAAALGFANDAAASVTAAVSAAGATLWTSGATVAQYATVISPLRGATYRRLTATGAGTTDPALDPANYVLISGLAYLQTADQAITAGGGLTIAHGLGRVPLFVQPFIRNLTAEAGYSAGDVLAVPSGITLSGSSGVAQNAAITCDATNIYVRFANGSTVFSIANKGTGGSIGATSANWSFFIRVQA